MRTRTHSRLPLCLLVLFLSQSLASAQGMIALLNLKTRAGSPPVVKTVKEQTKGRNESTEQVIISQIADIYRQLLQREPDGGGLAYYVEQVVNGLMTVDDVSQAIARSPEYFSLHPDEPIADNATYDRLKSIADNLAGSQSRACYRTAVATAARNGGLNDGWQWWTSTSYRGESLNALAQAIADGTLRGGMVIYMNTAPGRDRASMNLSYRPHWMTYLGRDGGGTPRFSDQYGTSYSLSDVANTYSPRLIDAFFNPYQSN